MMNLRMSFSLTKSLGFEYSGCGEMSRIYWSPAKVIPRVIELRRDATGY